MAAIRIQPFDESTQIQRLGVGATVGGLILIGVVSVSSSFNAASVLIALGAVAVPVNG